MTWAFELEVENAGFGNKSMVNTTGMTRQPPPQTSGTLQEVEGSGGVTAGGESIVLSTGEGMCINSSLPVRVGDNHDGLGGELVRLTLHQIVEMNAVLLKPNFIQIYLIIF